MNLEGAKKVTCKEAAQLLKEEKIIKAWFRPNGPEKPPYSDEDPAFVWFA